MRLLSKLFKHISSGSRNACYPGLYMLVQLKNHPIKVGQNSRSEDVVYYRWFLLKVFPCLPESSYVATSELPTQRKIIYIL